MRIFKPGKKFEYLIILLLIAVFIAIKIPSFVEPNWVFDEGIYAAVAHGISFPHSLLYHNDWDNKPPTIYLIFYISQHLFSYNILPLRIFIALLEALTAFFTFKISLAFFHRKPTAYLSLITFLIFMFFDGNIVNAEVIFIFFTTFAIYLIRDFDLNKNFKVLFAGLLMGIALTIKIPTIFDFAGTIYFLVLLFLFNNERCIKRLLSIVLFAFGESIPFLIYIIYFKFNNSLSSFFYAVFGYNRMYIQVFHTQIFGISEINFQIICFFIFLLILTTFFKKMSSRSFFIILWSLCAYTAALTSGRAYFHYLIQLAVPISLLIGYVVIEVKWHIKITSLLIIYLLSLYFYHHGSYYFTPSNVYSKLKEIAYEYSYISGKTKQKDFYSSFVVGTDLTAYQQNQIIKYLNGISGKKTIFLWADLPWVYAANHEENICNYVIKYNFYDAAPNGYATTCVSNNLPDIFVLQKTTHPHTFDSLLETKYLLIKSFDKQHLYIYEKL